MVEWNMVSDDMYQRLSRLSRFCSDVYVCSKCPFKNLCVWFNDLGFGSAPNTWNHSDITEIVRRLLHLE